jgi:hypothetical protein
MAGGLLVNNSGEVTAQSYEKRAMDTSNIADILTNENSVPFLN